MSNDLLLRDVRPMGGAAADVLIRAGRIAEIATGHPRPPGTPVEDGQGALLMPGLVEAHTHVDKNLLGLPWQPQFSRPPRSRT